MEQRQGSKHRPVSQGLEGGRSQRSKAKENTEHIQLGEMILTIVRFYDSMAAALVQN